MKNLTTKEKELIMQIKKYFQNFQKDNSLNNISHFIAPIINKIEELGLSKNEKLVKGFKKIGWLNEKGLNNLEGKLSYYNILSSLEEKKQFVKDLIELDKSLEKYGNGIKSNFDYKIIELKNTIKSLNIPITKKEELLDSIDEGIRSIETFIENTKMFANYSDEDIKNYIYNDLNKFIKEETGRKRNISQEKLKELIIKYMENSRINDEELIDNPYSIIHKILDSKLMKVSYPINYPSITLNYSIPEEKEIYKKYLEHSKFEKRLVNYIPKTNYEVINILNDFENYEKFQKKLKNINNKLNEIKNQEKKLESINLK